MTKLIELVGDGDDLPHLDAVQELSDLGIGAGRGFERGGVQADGDLKLGSHLAVDLHGDLDRVVDQVGRVGLGERGPGEALGVAEAAPQLLGRVRGERGQHQHHRLRHRAGHAAVRVLRREVVVELGDAGDRGVEAQRLHAVAHGRDRAVQHPEGLLVGRVLGDVGLPGVLVEDGAPDALQQAEHADDGLRLPRAALLERAGEHLVEPQRVGAELLDEVVGRDHVLQALADLPELAVHLGVAVEELAAALLDLAGLHVEAARVGVGGCLDVALVHETAERLARAQVPEVEEHLVPERARRGGAARRAPHRRRRGRRRRCRPGTAGPSSSARPRGRRRRSRWWDRGSAARTSTSRPSSASCSARGGRSSDRRRGRGRPPPSRRLGPAAVRARRWCRRRRRCAASSRRPRAAAPAARGRAPRSGRSCSSNTIGNGSPQ